MKKLLVIAVLLVLAGCDNQWSDSDYSTSTNLFTSICIDGVEYWIRATGHKGYLAVRIDPNTLMPKRCKM